MKHSRNGSVGVLISIQKDESPSSHKKECAEEFSTWVCTGLGGEIWTAILIQWAIVQAGITATKGKHFHTFSKPYSLLVQPVTLQLSFFLILFFFPRHISLFECEILARRHKGLMSEAWCTAQKTMSQTFPKIWNSACKVCPTIILLIPDSWSYWIFYHSEFLFFNDWGYRELCTEQLKLKVYSCVSAKSVYMRLCRSLPS